MRLLTLMVLLLIPQEATDLDKQIDKLVEQLKYLFPDDDRAAFLFRPALSRLMSLGPKALPRLKHHFLKQEDWRLKASVGYLAVLLGRNDAEVNERWRELCKDPDIFVRMAMISLTSQFSQGCIVQWPVMTPEEQSVIDRIELPTELHWMSEEDLTSLTANTLAILKEGKPLVDPPYLEMQAGMCLDPNPKRLRSSGVRRLTHKTKMAELSLNRALNASNTHKSVKLVMEAAEADDGSDPPRLGHLFRMASSAAWHGDGCMGGGSQGCSQAPESKRRLFALCEKWAWKVTDPNAQYGLLWALDAVGLWKSYDLRERLSKEHPDEQVRELAGSNLNRLWNSMLDRGHTREGEAVDDRQLEEAKKRR